MAVKKVLIAVKTYPTISVKYDELVCTAGFLEDGSWIRIYPIPFRKKTFGEQYHKYEWIEIDLIRNERDFRPESFRPVSEDTLIRRLGSIDTANNWQERKELILREVYTNLSELISEAKDKDKRKSLAVFKPNEIIDFIVEPQERDWDREKLMQLEQLNLFDSRRSDGTFDVVKKLPYKFSYRLLDDQGKSSRMMIEDWELGALFWRQLAKYEGDEKMAIADVRKKYFDDFARTKDLYLFLGTTLSFHLRSNNPFMIIGTFHPKKEHQISLFG
ncbi:MAG: hypothetical protein ACRC3B_03000 [Bacteroidia bacterium]